MHQLVPRQVAVFPTSTSGHIYPYGCQNYYMYAFVPDWSDAIEVSEPGYFWQTHGRYMNNCCHSKLVGSGKNRPPFLFTTNGLALMPSVKCCSLARGVERPTNMTSWKIGHTRFNCVGSVSLSSWKLTASYAQIEFNFSCSLVERADRGVAKGKAFGAGVRIRWNNGSTNPTLTKLSLMSSWPIWDTLEPIMRKWVLKYYHWTYRQDNTYPRVLELEEEFYNYLDNFIIWSSQHATYGQSMSATLAYVASSVPSDPPDSRFLLHEKEILVDKLPSYIVQCHDTSGYWRDYLIQHAYYDCLQSVPRMNENNIANLLDGVKFLKSLIVNKRIEMPKSISDGWLSYRYAYSTTKSDVEQAISYAKRHLATDIRPFTCYGSSSCTYEDTEILCSCRCDVKNKELSYLDQIWKNLETYGLSPSFYTFWDLLPYSFIVDWFIPMGDVLSVVDARQIYSEEKYDITNICYSLSYYRYIDGIPWKQYTRWVASSPPALNGLYWLEPKGVSNKTVGFRILDAAALILR